MKISRIARQFSLVGVIAAALAIGPGNARATTAKPAVTPAAWSYQPLTWSLNNGGQGGPVLSPEIVPLFWGRSAADWSVGDGQTDDDPRLITKYIDNFANYISGVGQPAGEEPVTKQYGVWGALRYTTGIDSFLTCNGPCSIGDTSIADVGVQQRIQR